MAGIGCGNKDMHACIPLMIYHFNREAKDKISFLFRAFHIHSGI